MKQYISIFLFLSILFATDCVYTVTQESQESQVDVQDTLMQSGLESAEKWLKLVDERKYAESWDAGSLTLKLTVPKGHWISLMDKIRKPLGNEQSRNLVTQRRARDPKGLPKGEYMVVLFQSSFSNKASVNELVTLVLESDGNWKVLTYQFQ